MNRILLAILPLAAVFLPIALHARGTEAERVWRPTDTTLLRDERFATACGPIACLVALKAVGIGTSLADIVKRLEWSEGQVTRLDKISKFLASTPGVECRPCRLSSDDLITVLRRGDAVALLPTRKFSESIDHVAVAVGASPPWVSVIDYPELLHPVPRSKLEDRWDGEVLLVSRSPQPLAAIKIPVTMVLAGLALAFLGKALAAYRTRPRWWQTHLGAAGLFQPQGKEVSP